MLDLTNCNCVLLENPSNIFVSKTNKYIKDFSHYRKANRDLLKAKQQYGLWEFRFTVEGHFVRIAATQIVSSEVHYYERYWCREKLLADGYFILLK